MVDERAGRFMEIEYAYQKLEDIPERFAVPEERQRPWGTGTCGAGVHSSSSTVRLL